MIGRSPERIGLNSNCMKHNYRTSLAVLFGHHISGKMAFRTWLLATLVFTTTAASDSGPYRTNEARVKAIAANPQAIGLKEIEFLSAHSYFHQAIKALSEASAPEARAALQAAAIGGNQYAARLLVRGLTNKDEGLKLLDSKSPEVQAIALRGLLGSHGIGPVSLDREAWEIVKSVLHSEDLELRRIATRITALDSGAAVPVTERAKAIAASMTTTLSSPDARKDSRYGGEDWSYAFPLGEGVLAEQAVALGWMKGVTKEMLEALTPPGLGLVREAMVIVRFNAGDQTVRGELHQVLTNSPSGCLRMVVLEQALNFRTVTEADRECLERMAAADPLEGKPGSQYARLTGDKSLEDKREATIYPARILAGLVLRALDARKNPPVPGP